MRVCSCVRSQCQVLAIRDLQKQISEFEMYGCEKFSSGNRLGTGGDRWLPVL